MAEPRLNGSHYCDGDECTALMPDDGEADGWTVWRSERRTSLLCPDCTGWSSVERDVSDLRDTVTQQRKEIERLRDDLYNERMGATAARVGVEVLAEKLGALRTAALKLSGVYDHPDLDAKHLRRAVDDLAQVLDETQL